MDHSTTRRDFLRTSCSAATLLTLGWALSGCDSSSMTEVEQPAEDGGITIEGNTITLDLTGSEAGVVAEAGGFLLLSSAHTIILNPSGDAIRAFTSICTHQGCDVNSFRNGTIVCPCHGSQYDTNGEVVQGPAPNPLREFDVVRDGDIVTITKA